MSRAMEGDGDSPFCLLWPSIAKRATEGKRGQKLLKELEDALLELPDKRLISGAFAHGGEVCALGSVAVKRKVAAGVTRHQALSEVADEFVNEYEDQLDHEETGLRLKMSKVLAWEIMFANDDHGSKATPEERYQYVLKWVQDRISR